MGWLNPSALFGEIDAERELETEQDRLRRHAAIRSRTRPAQLPTLSLVEEPTPVEEPKPLGRPPLPIDLEKIEAVIVCIAAGASFDAACHRAQIDQTTMRRWFKARPDDSDRLADARAARRELRTQVRWTQLEERDHGFGQALEVSREGWYRPRARCSCGWIAPSLARSDAAARSAWKRHVEGSAR